MEVDKEPGSALLRALQLSDSFFPTGAYAHSQGLEGMVAMGWVRNAAEVEEYLADLLRDSIIPSGGLALLQAHGRAAAGATATIIDIDRLLHSMMLPEEQRRASTQVGRRLLDESLPLLQREGMPQTWEEFRNSVVEERSPSCGAVAFGVTAWAEGIGPRAAFQGYCHGFVVGALGASQRLAPITHSQAQHILRALHETIIDGYGQVRTRHWRDMTSFAPWADIASMTHESASARMFAS